MDRELSKITIGWLLTRNSYQMVVKPLCFKVCGGGKGRGGEERTVVLSVFF